MTAQAHRGGLRSRVLLILAKSEIPRRTAGCLDSLRIAWRKLRCVRAEPDRPLRKSDVFCILIGRFESFSNPK